MNNAFNEITEVCPHCENEMIIAMPETEYIDRNALLKSLFSDEPAAMEDYYYNAISSFPSSDVAPVIHAKWIHDGQRVKGGVDWYHCSNCLSPESVVYVHRPYCSWCGAKMESDK